VSEYRYYVYITTNKNKTVLYIGVTNNISRRLVEHIADKTGFAGKYRCHNLVYCEIYENVVETITREKEIKKWRREKKIRLIEAQNPEWRFMNDEIV
jgi:putative endonuclease